MKLQPLSPKARKILEEKLGGNPKINIEKRMGSKVLFSSQNGNYCGWIDLKKDPDWIIVLSH
jgi:hypothetical protein